MTDPEDVVRKGSYTMTYGKQATLDGNFILQYSKDIAKKHSINAAFNMLLSENKFTESTFKAEGFPSDQDEQHQLRPPVCRRHDSPEL